MERRAAAKDASRETASEPDEPPSIATRRTGSGDLEAREIVRAGNGAVAEGLPPTRETTGAAGDPQPTSADGPVIQGIQGAPGAHSALGNTRGLSRPPHDKGDE